VDLFRPFVYLLAGIGLFALAGAGYMKLAEKGIDAASATKESQASFGELVRVGDLDFTVLNVARWSSAAAPKGPLGQPMALSKPNFVVQVEATNARGAEGRTYEFSPLSMKVIDDAGVVHEAVTCLGCPGQLSGGLPARIVNGGTLEASFYFQLPADRLPAAVQYRPVFSQKAVKVDVRGAVR
jgi:hypothetical protein